MQRSAPARSRAHRAALAGLGLAVWAVPASSHANPIVRDPHVNEACHRTLREPGCRRCGSLRAVNPLSVSPGDPGIDACREYLDDGYTLRCRESSLGNYYVVCRDPSPAESAPSPARAASGRRPPSSPVEPTSGCAVGPRSSSPPVGPAAWLAALVTIGVRRVRRRHARAGRPRRTR